jgi:hypothetical protein
MVKRRRQPISDSEDHQNARSQTSKEGGITTALSLVTLD